MHGNGVAATARGAWPTPRGPPTSRPRTSATRSPAYRRPVVQPMDTPVRDRPTWRPWCACSARGGRRGPSRQIDRQTRRALSAQVHGQQHTVLCDELQPARRGRPLVILSAPAAPGSPGMSGHPLPTGRREPYVTPWSHGPAPHWGQGGRLAWSTGPPWVAPVTGTRPQRHGPVHASETSARTAR